MSLAITDLHAASVDVESAGPVRLLAPYEFATGATAAYEDAELLLGAILPDARLAHVGATAVAGAHSRGRVDVFVAIPRGAFEEALGVLLEAGYVPDPRHARGEQACWMLAPDAESPLSLHVVVSGSRHEALVATRDALRRDPALVDRYNSVRLEAAPRGAAAYREAQRRFFASLSA